MKKKIASTYWLPPEVTSVMTDEFELVFPQEKVTGVFSMDEIKKMLPDVDGIIIMAEKFDRDVIQQGLGGKLKVIGRCGVGCDSVDVEFAGQNGVGVINTPHSVTDPTAELAISLILASARSIARLDRKLRKDGFCDAPPGYDGASVTVNKKTLGIIGFGRIGKAVAKKARGLGMNIIYSDMIQAPKELEDELGAKKVTTEELLRQADFVTLHCPYIPENHHLINAKTLKMMKPSAYLINASRGKMVDEQALVDALNNGTIKGAGLDVYENEPEINPGLLSLENVVMVPHVGTCCFEARVDMSREALTGMMAFLKGENPPNLFNREFMKK